ncbi:hypothetical protein OAN307_c20350 [Octadecabacter antarcticus 307]|uniref:Uncharacterized protein n=1 Tax=Octadecabacter antarcticus 307 TaxID=391626 RepID=M9RCX0_9RHOB|nr:hypothetical protein OAN307_c20350 [Octadecabacter antarcticus 307]
MRPPMIARDVRKVGHFGTGHLEVTVRSNLDFYKAKSLIEQTYEGAQFCQHSPCRTRNGRVHVQL